MGLRWTQAHASAAPGRTALPEPEQVFLRWLLSQPPGGELLAAALREAARLSRYSGPQEGPRRLARMFAELIDHLEESKRRGSRLGKEPA